VYLILYLVVKNLAFVGNLLTAKATHH